MTGVAITHIDFETPAVMNVHDKATLLSKIGFSAYCVNLATMCFVIFLHYTKTIKI